MSAAAFGQPHARSDRSVLQFSHHSTSAVRRALIAIGIFIVLFLGSDVLPSPMIGSTTSPMQQPKQQQSPHELTSPKQNHDDDDDGAVVRMQALPATQILFLHPGKSGGGTFLYRAADAWRLNITECHPRPCNKLINNNRAEHTHMLSSATDQ